MQAEKGLSMIGMSNKDEIGEQKIDGHSEPFAHHSQSNMPKAIWSREAASS
jgi:hypothetical protein